MQVMVGLEQAGIAQRVEVGDAIEKGLFAILVETEIAHAKSVTHGCDAGGGALGVVSNERRTRWPACRVARLDLPLEVVGVKVDNAWEDEVAVQILPVDVRLVDRRNPAVT